MPVQDQIARGKALIWTDNLEGQARGQVANLTRLGFLDGHVAVMPDAHWGKGTTVGSVIPTKEAIIPAAVGVDLGCGMMAVETTLRAENLPDSLKPVRERIEAAIPVGGAARVLHDAPIENPVREAYRLWWRGEVKNRSSWDQLAVLYGVRGLGGYFENVTQGEGRLRNGFTWSMKPGSRTYLALRMDKREIEALVGALMAAPPRRSGSAQPLEP